jgi:hypothetical protein
MIKKSKKNHAVLQSDFAETLEFSSIQDTAKETFEERLQRFEKSFPNESGDNQPNFPTKRIQLPLWPEETRAQANSLIRSALFSATNPSSKREQYEKKNIASIEGIEIFYTGTQLNQSDADVLDAVFHVCRESQLGVECRVTGYHLLKLLNKKDSKQNYIILDTQLTRMKATALRIRLDKRWSYEGSLIHDIRRDEENKDYLIALNPQFSKLFQKDQYTLINHYLLLKLQGYPLAQWTVRYFSSHAEPFPMRFATIRELSGSNIKKLTSFRQKFKKAIEKIVAVHSLLYNEDKVYKEYNRVKQQFFCKIEKRGMKKLEVMC